ncbi:MAG: 4-hydroxybenzoate octaprenyltransferase [Pseudomonadota bacterium]
MMSEANQQPTIIRDANAQNWVDRTAPAFAKPYFKLARFDRPIGAWLLLFPCWWGQALGHVSAGHAWPNLFYGVLFLIGAFVMRGAGCTWNDIVDRKYDGRVDRTQLRPIPSGQVTVWQALLFGILLCLIGLAVLLQFNQFTVWLGISSLGLVAIYPFFKRFTYWPQVILGLTFKWGALVGWAAIHGSLAVAPVLLYAGCVLWTIGYDTIYAHQDKEDDATLGLKSTALRFGDETPKWLFLFYGGAAALWAFSGYLAGTGTVFAIALGLVVLHCLWQILTLDTNDPDNCLTRFKSNRYVGWLFLAGLLGEMVLHGQ